MSSEKEKFISSVLRNEEHQIWLLDSYRDPFFLQVTKENSKIISYVTSSNGKHISFDQTFTNKLESALNEDDEISIIFNTTNKILETISELEQKTLTTNKCTIYFLNCPNYAFYKSVSQRLSQNGFIAILYKEDVLVLQHVSIAILKEHAGMTQDIHSQITRNHLQIKETNWELNRKQLENEILDLRRHLKNIQKSNKSVYQKLKKIFKTAFCYILSQSQKKNKTLVSIIVTVYNAEKTLERSIRSLMDQSHSDIEIIIVDDCSTDNSLSIAERLALEDKRITVIASLKNRGTFYCKNIGLVNATGKYITFQDADDTSTKDRIQKQKTYLEQKKAIAVTCNYLRYSNESSFGTPDEKHAIISLFFRKVEVISRIGYFDPVRFGGDSEFYERLLATFGRNRIIRSNEVLYTAYTQPNSLTAQKKSRLEKPDPQKNSPRAHYAERYKSWHTSGKGLFMNFNTNTRPFNIDYTEQFPIKKGYLPLKILVSRNLRNDTDSTFFDITVKSHLDLKKINFTPETSSKKLEIYFLKLNYTPTEIEKLQRHFHFNSAIAIHKIEYGLFKKIDLKICISEDNLKRVIEEICSIDSYNNIKIAERLISSFKDIFVTKQTKMKSIDLEKKVIKEIPASQEDANLKYLQLNKASFQRLPFIPSAKFNVVGTAWNCQKEIDCSVLSILNQRNNGNEMELTICDDASDDETYRKLLALKRLNNFRLLRNEVNHGAAFSRWKILKEIPLDDRIVILMDMDDYLLENAFQKVSEAYLNNPNCLMTYGNWTSQDSDNTAGKYSRSEIEKIEESTSFKCAPLRTFKANALHGITEDNFIDAKGNWFQVCTDVALMLPIIKNCHFNDITYIGEPIYYYNRNRPGGTLTKMSANEKSFIFDYIRKNKLNREAPN